VVDGPTLLFVYGTLMAGEPNADQIPDQLVRRRRAAWLRGSLVDLGRYPALRLDDGGVVVGELLELVAEGADDLLQRLDAFEGPGYERGLHAVHVDDDDRHGDCGVRAWVFVQVSGGDGGRRIPDGDWRAWRRRA
jgi:gamma-glutamylcyclotransferase (GGCT)/AIG2-like uncharacterized protein YtfP